MTSTIEHAARELVAARARRAAAKKALLAYRQEHGGCDHYDEPGVGVTCYHAFSKQAMDDWCEICKGAEPLWQARQKAAADVGIALRRLTRACEKQVGA